MKKYRVVSLLLCLIMLITVLPVSAADAKEYSVTKGDYVRLLGRGETAGGQRTFNWPGSGFELTFSGSYIEVYVAAIKEPTYNAEYEGSYFTTAVYDGEKLIRSGRVKLKAGWNKIYSQLPRDPQGERTVMFVRSSEACCGTVKISKIKTDAPPKATEPREKLIEFIGDSYTTGYQNSPSLSNYTGYCAQNTDNWNCYTGMVARHYGADYNVLAYQGKGAYMNIYDGADPKANPMSTLFLYEDVYLDTAPNLNMSTKSLHDFKQQPDLVTVWLGTNDANKGANESEFEEAYGKFLDTIREKYPKATILSMCQQVCQLSDAVKRAIEAENRGEKNGFYFLLLDNFQNPYAHPVIEEEERITAQIVKKIDSIPGVWGDEPVAEEPVATPEEPAVTPEAPLAPLARYTSSKVLVNGEAIGFEAYNISDNNYFKLRDLAKAFSGTEKQFEVTWDAQKGMIGLLSGKAYTVVGGELAAGDGTNKSAVIFTGGILKDGSQVKALAYNINGNNYFKLRDICKLFDIGVAWDGAQNTISLNTSVGYTE